VQLRKGLTITDLSIIEDILRPASLATQRRRRYGKSTSKGRPQMIYHLDPPDWERAIVTGSIENILLCSNFEADLQKLGFLLQSWW
jgi:hypothetical protein